MNKFNYVLLATLLLTIGCGKGDAGITGAAGKSGASAKFSSIVLPLDRAATPWDDNNKTEVNYDQMVYLPSSFEFSNLTNTENGGWIDVKIGSETFCYQGKISTRIYDFKYKKIDGHVNGCDSNNEKFTGKTSFQVLAKKDSIVQAIPRAPRLNGVYNELELVTLGVE